MQSESSAHPSRPRGPPPVSPDRFTADSRGVDGADRNRTFAASTHSSIERTPYRLLLGRSSSPVPRVQRKQRGPKRGKEDSR